MKKKKNAIWMAIIAVLLVVLPTGIVLAYQSSDSQKITVIPSPAVTAEPLSDADVAYRYAIVQGKLSEDWLGYFKSRDKEGLMNELDAVMTEIEKLRPQYIETGEMTTALQELVDKQAAYAQYLYPVGRVRIQESINDIKKYQMDEGRRLVEEIAPEQIERYDAFAALKFKLAEELQADLDNNADFAIILNKYEVLRRIQFNHEYNVDFVYYGEQYLSNGYNIIDIGKKLGITVKIQ